MNLIDKLFILFVLIHIISIPISLYLKVINLKSINLSDVLVSISFGCLDLFVQIRDLDTVFWRRKEKD